jgi:hypothetical protein
LDDVIVRNRRPTTPRSLSIEPVRRPNNVCFGNLRIKRDGNGPGSGAYAILDRGLF